MDRNNAAGILMGAFMGLWALTAQAATFTVTKTADAADGVCDVADCSLREAVIAANAAPGVDAIVLPAGTFVLSLAGLGEDASATGDLDIKSNLTISGAGAKQTVIDGNGAILSDRVFHIVQGDVTISDVTIQNGSKPNFPGAGTGGEDPASNMPPEPGFGVGDGGGILVNESGNLTLSDSVVSNNKAVHKGGGITSYGSLTVKGCTISNNKGGGITHMDTQGSFTMTDSTVSNNSVHGIFVMNNSQAAILTNVTISNSSGKSYTMAIGSYGPPNGIPAKLKNVILADNFENCDSYVVINSLGHNLDADGSCHLTGPGDLANVDPKLGTLADNGGPTPTQALLAGSPAIDAGDDNGCPAHDQRGYDRPVGNGCDIGAFESQETMVKVPKIYRELQKWPQPPLPPLKPYRQKY